MNTVILIVQYVIILLAGVVVQSQIRIVLMKLYILTTIVKSS